MSGDGIYRRYKPAVTAESASEDAGYWFIFNPTRLLVAADGPGILRLRSLAELGLSPVRTCYLGILQGLPCYSAEVSPDTVAPEGTNFSELRSLYGILDEDIYLLAGKAIQIVNWDRTNQFCGMCGHETEPMSDERAKKCPACGFTSYPRLSPAAITAVLKDDKILLTHNVAFRANMYSLVAGFVELGETLEECVEREILEEAGIHVKNIKYFGSQPWPFPNSLMIGFTAEYESGEISVDGTEISDAGWYDADHLPELPPRMSIARKIIDWFIDNHASREPKDL